MKLVVAIACLLFLVALFAATSTPAQEQPLDVGEQALLVRACDLAYAIGHNEQIGVKWCRQNGIPVVTGNQAVVPVKVMTTQGKYEGEIHLERSLWSVDALKFEPSR